MLEETAALVTGDARAALLDTVSGNPLPKPADHKGGVATDMFETALPTEMVRSIAETIRDAARRGLRTPRSTRIGGFAAAWGELEAWQAKGA